MSSERKVKGVWIPIEIWEHDKLNITEKVIITEIDSFSNSDIGCFISNNHFAKFTGLSASRCSSIINDLSKRGFIDIELVRDGHTGHIKKRYLKLSKSLVSEMKVGVSDMKEGISETKRASFGNSEGTNTLSITNTSNISNKDIVGKSRFTPPSLEEVDKYCKERDNGIDPQSFIDFYSSKGWYVGKNKMKDWKASIRTWERRNGNKPKSVKKEKTSFSDLI